MTRINDYHESKARKASATNTWVWEVKIYEWSNYLYDFCQKTVAYFFDPWKAVKYGKETYNGNFMVELRLLSTRELTDEKGVK